MADKSLTFNIFGKDVSASKTLNNVGRNAEGMGKSFGKMSSLIGAGLGVIGIAATGRAIGDFLKTSVEAYKDAELQQTKLEDAYKRFPAIASVSIGKLREYNTALSYKTGYDDDAIASGQAVLAQFGLTGQQLLKITPLFVDYATKTGQDLPTASEALGKALLGNSRALKTIGINFKATGDRATDVQTIIGLLQGKVGGFAEQVGTTDAGKIEILNAKFNDIKEKVGGAVLPAFSGLVDYISNHLLPTLDELGKGKGIDDFFATIEKHGKGGDTFGFLDPKAWQHGADQWKEWANNGKVDPTKTGGPLDPGPWQNGWAQITQFTRTGIASIAQANANGHNNMATNNAQSWIRLGAGAQAGWNVLVQKAQAGGGRLVAGFQTAMSRVTAANGRFWADMGARFANGWAQIQGFFSGHPFQVRAAIVWTNTSPPPLSPNGGGVRPLAVTAVGGLFNRAQARIIGEAGPEAVVPLNRRLSAVDGSVRGLSAYAQGMGGGGGGGNLEVHIHVQGIVAGTQSGFSKAVYTAFVDGIKRGDIPRNALPT